MGAEQSIRADYFQGVEDCKAGRPHDMTRSLEYTRGYGDEYAYQQELTHRSESNGA